MFRKDSVIDGKPKRKSTLDLELYYFNSHIVPALGDYELSNLARAHIQKFFKGLSKRVDPKTGNETGSDSTAQRCKINRLLIAVKRVS